MDGLSYRRVARPLAAIGNLGSDRPLGGSRGIDGPGRRPRTGSRSKPRLEGRNAPCVLNVRLGGRASDCLRVLMSLRSPVEQHASG